MRRHVPAGFEHRPSKPVFFGDSAVSQAIVAALAAATGSDVGPLGAATDSLIGKELARNWRENREVG